jgi:hypothetical protein
LRVKSGKCRVRGRLGERTGRRSGGDQRRIRERLWVCDEVSVWLDSGVVG